MPKRGRKKSTVGKRSSKRKRAASPSGDLVENDEQMSVELNEENNSDVEDEIDETDSMCLNDKGEDNNTAQNVIKDLPKVQENSISASDNDKKEAKDPINAPDISSETLPSNLENVTNADESDKSNSNDINSGSKLNSDSSHSLPEDKEKADIDNSHENNISVNEDQKNDIKATEDANLSHETVKAVDKTNSSTSESNTKVEEVSLTEKAANISNDESTVDLNPEELEEIKRQTDEIAAQRELELKIKQEKELEELKAKQKADAEALIMKARKQKEEEELKIKKQKELELKIKKQRELEAARKVAELQSLWEPVKASPEDFNAWTKLLDYVENDKNIENIRPVYDEFLKRFPYCYGYWRKYTELESDAGNIERCIMIFEKGLSPEGIELSVDLWIAYLDWAHTNLQSESNADHMRELYERSLKSAGLDFRSDKLWEHYINWETRAGKLSHVTALYDRLLTTPTQMYYQNWESFKRHIEENDPRATIPEKELKALLESLVVDDSEKVSISFLGSYQYKCTQSFIESREKTSYQTTYGAISDRWNYEEKIRRPYFHIKPLENSQLTNWNEYLDFEILKGDPERIRVLFERCLIACAMYEYFWIKYAKYMENTLGDLDAARDVWRRACTIHLLTKPTVHWYSALFEERFPESKDSPKAVEILSKLEENVPTNVIVASRKIDALRRSGAKPEEMCSAFESSIERFKNRSLYPSASIITSKYARYLHKVMLDSDKAIKVLQSAIDEDQRNESLYRQLLDIVYQKQPLDVSMFCQLATAAIESSLLAPDAKISICKRKLQVVEEFEADPNKLKEAYNEYETLNQAAKSSEEMVTSSKNLSQLLGTDPTDANLSDPNVNYAAYSAGIYDPLMQLDQPTSAAKDQQQTNQQAADNSKSGEESVTTEMDTNQETARPTNDTTNSQNNYYSQYQYQEANYPNAWNPWNAYYTNYQNAQYSSWNTANSAPAMPHYSG